MLIFRYQIYFRYDSHCRKRKSTKNKICGVGVRRLRDQPSSWFDMMSDHLTVHNSPYINPWWYWHRISVTSHSESTLTRLTTLEASDYTKEQERQCWNKHFSDRLFAVWILQSSPEVTYFRTCERKWIWRLWDLVSCIVGRTLDWKQTAEENSGI
jgi:hypothetical protein